jgi:hypothetical protein
MKILRVKWLDIVVVSERIPLDIAKESDFAECENVGFLVYEDDHKLIIAPSYQKIPQDTTNETFEAVSEYSVIPKGCIKSIEELK